MADTQSVVRYSPLHNVVFACIFQDEDKAGKAMLEFLNAVMQCSMWGRSPLHRSSA